jgi:histidyl-tRNA synthetase
MKIQSPPGMRDFYPEDMRLQNWLFDAWRRVSLAFGFSEYEGPIFEFLDLYTLKSGEGIVSELFTFQDRGERKFAIRPEMTPTLARMVAARANTLPRPIKWFSIPRMCRAEKPQRGRLREFFQWNADILGVEDPLADAEVIAVAVAFFREIGLSEKDIVIRVSSRPMAAAALAGLGIPSEENARAFELIDRFDRLSQDDFAEMWDEVYGARVAAATLIPFLAEASRADCLAQAAAAGADGQAAADVHTKLWEHLDALGVADACAFDLRTVRGLAYYTGTVFEAHTRAGGLRALMGGGRYDDLTGLLDGPRVPGVGFGMGDAPVLECLRALKRLPDLDEHLDVFLIDADAALFPKVLEFADQLRRHGLTVDFSYKRSGVGKQFKQAAGRGARYAVVVGGEYATSQQLAVKNLSSGQQQEVAAERLLADPAAALAAV